MLSGEASGSRGGARILLILAVVLSATALAEGVTWKSGGPYGGRVYALVQDRTTPSILYSGTGGGVYRSTDSGVSWSPRTTGIGIGAVYALAIDPTSSSTLYAASDGLYRSTDSGETWVRVSRGLASAAVYCVVVDPTRPSRLHAGTSEGVFLSTDSGGSWARSGDGSAFTFTILTLVMDPTTPTTLYAGSSGHGAFRSTDSGRTWSSCTAWATSLLRFTARALAIDPGTPSALYLGTDYDGVLKSTDAGESWIPASTGLPSPAFVRTLTLDPANPATLYAGTYGGVFRSTDAGGSWSAASASLPGVAERVISSVVIDPVNPAHLHLGTYGGPFRSTDSGGSWTPVGAGLTNLSVTSLAASPWSPGVIYAGASYGQVFRTTDSGTTWSLVNEGLTHPGTGYDYSQVYALAVSPSTQTTLYAAIAGTDSDPTVDDGVFRTTDSGQTWTRADAGLPIYFNSVRTLAVDPSRSSTLYAGSAGRGVFRSTDGGATWVSVGPERSYVSALAFADSTPPVLYAATDGGLFRSTDSGRTWIPSNVGLPVSPYPGIGLITVARSSPSTLYGIVADGIYRSTDSGGSWTRTSARPSSSYVTALTASASTPSTLFAGTSRDGVLRSTDSGATWTSLSADVPYRHVGALALDPTGEATVYAGFVLGSVWQASLRPEETATTLLLPASARGPGLGGAFYTTDLTVANTGPTPTTFVLKFLDHDVDGREGPERSFSIAAGATTTFVDVLGSVFGVDEGFGAIRISSPSGAVRALSQTSTPAFGGTVGQSVPAARPEDLVTGGAPRSILAVREDGSVRTNLILANATAGPLEVDVALVADDGGVLGTRRSALPPLGMTQISRVVRALGVVDDVAGARLVVSTPSGDGRFAAYASAIDQGTNDPRALLPILPEPGGGAWILPSSARSEGSGGAFYTTDLTIACPGAAGARYTLQLLGHDRDGRDGPAATFDLGSGKSVTYRDVLGSVFGAGSGYGAIQVTSSGPIVVVSQTATPGFGGTVGQSVPASAASDLIRAGTTRSILAIREDAAFRTNLVLANGTESALRVDARLVSREGAVRATRRYTLASLGMTQVTRVVRDMGIVEELDGARLEVSTPDSDGAFVAYASVIDNVTNDPRTVLPR